MKVSTGGSSCEASSLQLNSDPLLVLELLLGFGVLVDSVGVLLLYEVCEGLGGMAEVVHGKAAGAGLVLLGWRAAPEAGRELEEGGWEGGAREVLDASIVLFRPYLMNSMPSQQGGATLPPMGSSV
jgi:hypothetical protein